MLVRNIGLRDLWLSGQGLGAGAASTDEGVKSGLAEHDGPRVDDVVGVELIGGQDVDPVEVAHGQPGDLLAAIQDDEHLAELGETGEDGLGLLGRGLVTVNQGGHDEDAIVASHVGQSATQSSSHHLLGGALSVGARLRTVNGAATDPLWCTGRTLTGTTGALLAPRLLATTGDQATSLRGVGALTSSRELGDDDLMDQRNVGVRVEDVTGKLSRPGLLALDVKDVDGLGLIHAASPFLAAFLAALRTTSRDPFGPGTAPRTSMIPRSASTE